MNKEVRTKPESNEKEREREKPTLLHAQCVNSLVPVLQTLGRTVLLPNCHRVFLLCSGSCLRVERDKKTKKKVSPQCCVVFPVHKKRCCCGVTSAESPGACGERLLRPVHVENKE